MNYRRYELERVCAEATPGPWIASGSCGSICHVVTPGVRADGAGEENPGTTLVAESMRSADVHFVCLARHVLPQLLAATSEPSEKFERALWDELTKTVGYSNAADIIQQMTLACVAAYQRGREDAEKKQQAATVQESAQ